MGVIGQGDVVQAPTLGDGAVTLRPHRSGDVDGIVAEMADPESRAWLIGLPPRAYTADDARAWLTSCAAGWCSGGSWALVVQFEGRYAGQVRLVRTGPGAVSIGYDLAPWARGRGVMSAAVRLFLTWAFTSREAAEEGALDVVHWRAIAGNWASRRVAWACGFTIEARVRGLLEQDGVRRDAWVGSLLAGEDLGPRSPWLDVPVIDLGHLVLRPYGKGDVRRIVEACSAASTQRWLPALPTPYTGLDAVDFIESREELHSRAEGIHWAVADTGGLLVAAVSVMDLLGRPARSGEIGYWTHPDARGRGVMTAALQAVSRHCLLPGPDGGLGLARVLVRVAAPNAASRRVAEKAGFLVAGRDRHAERLRDGTVVDFVRYDLLPEELTDPTDADPVRSSP